MSILENSVCVVPARGGSVRFPGKNKALLGGKPLVEHTLDLVEKVFEVVLYTSDCDELLELGKGRERVVCIKRPPDLATNTSKVIDTVKWGLGCVNSEELDTVWLSLPTAPLKDYKDFQNAIGLLDDGYTSVVSVTDFEFPPSLALSYNESLEANQLISSVCPSRPWELGHSRSQDHRVCYRPNGAIYGMYIEDFLEKGNWYTDYTAGYYMERERSVDIDTPLDLKIAEVLYNERNSIL